MGFFQEAYDAECAAIARALAVAAEPRRKLGRVRISTDSQAAITRMMHDEPGPGQTYALQARKPCASGSLLSRSRSAGTRAQRDPRERGRGRMGQAGRQRAG